MDSLLMFMEASIGWPLDAKRNQLTTLDIISMLDHIISMAVNEIDTSSLEVNRMTLLVEIFQLVTIYNGEDIWSAISKQPTSECL